MNTIPRPEYPRPQMVRQNWINLNGSWEFEIDQSVSGKERKLFEAEYLAGNIADMSLNAYATKSILGEAL